jgi:hypothetical protein
MTDLAPNDPAPTTSSADTRSILTNEWPYLAILGLALLGVAYTSVARQPIMMYWLVLAPFIGTTSVLTRWREVHGQELRLLLIWTNVLHWGGVLAAMSLIFVADVGQMMNSDAKALATLTLLALGTFLDGVHAGAWRLCLVGIILAASVPAIAWLEQSALLLVLVALVLIGLTAPLWLRDRKGIKKATD